jgi:hypothetical protein
MLRQIIIFISFSFLLTSCSLNPPDWLHGKWVVKKDSLKSDKVVEIWNISSNSVFNRNHEIESTSMITLTEIIEPKRYIIRSDHVLEDIPYFQIFKFNSKNEILYYDSSFRIPRSEYVLIKNNH